MNFASNLPEPTYKSERTIASFENTKKFLRSIAYLTKKLLML
ncbi:hypothetical protein [Gilvirhabdus luticola]|nr:hypothetical protein [Yeosuana sp. MJ-SS3]